MERFVFAPSVTILIAFIFSLFRYIGLTNRVVGVAIGAIILTLAAYLTYMHRSRIHFELSDIAAIGVFSLFVLSSIVFVNIPISSTNNMYVPDPERDSRGDYRRLNVTVMNLAKTSANDHLIPFRQAQALLNQTDFRKEPLLIKEWGVSFFMRTPLTGFVSAYYLDILSPYVSNLYPWRDSAKTVDYNYQIFQILNQTLNALLLLASYLFAKKFFSDRVALASITIMALNGYFLLNTFYTWPKSFVAFFIIISYYLLLSRRDHLYVGLFMGMAYLVHDLTLFYLPGIILILMHQERKNWRAYVRFIVPFLFFLLPWQLLAKNFGQQSLFLYYPFAINGIPFDSRTVITNFFSTPVSKILLAKFESLVFLVTPYQVIFETGSIWERVASSTIFNIFGATGLGLAPLALWRMWQERRKYWAIIAGLVIIPILMAIFMIGWPRGMNATHFAEAVVAILTMFGASKMFSLKPLWRVVFAGVIFIQYLSFLWYLLGPRSYVIVGGAKSQALMFLFGSIGFILAATLLWLLTKSQNRRVEG